MKISRRTLLTAVAATVALALPAVAPASIQRVERKLLRFSIEKSNATVSGDPVDVLAFYIDWQTGVWPGWEKSPYMRKWADQHKAQALTGSLSFNVGTAFWRKSFDAALRKTLEQRRADGAAYIVERDGWTNIFQVQQVDTEAIQAAIDEMHRGRRVGLSIRIIPHHWRG